MERYGVFLHDIPKVEGGKAVPVKTHRTWEFSTLGEAQKCASEHADQYERVVVMRLVGDQQMMIERYIDGEHILSEKEKEEPIL